MIGSSSLPSVENALPCSECECGGCDHVGTGRVQARVDGERGLIDRPVALDHRALVVDAHQVRDGDLTEVLGERIHPEGVAVLWVTHRNVTRDTFVVAKLCKQPKGSGQSLLEVEALGSRRREGLRQAFGGKHHGGVLSRMAERCTGQPWPATELTDKVFVAHHSSGKGTASGLEIAYTHRARCPPPWPSRGPLGWTSSLARVEVPPLRPLERIRRTSSVTIGPMPTRPPSAPRSPRRAIPLREHARGCDVFDESLESACRECRSRCRHRLASRRSSAGRTQTARTPRRPGRLRRPRGPLRAAFESDDCTTMTGDLSQHRRHRARLVVLDHRPAERRPTCHASRASCSRSRRSTTSAACPVWAPPSGPLVLVACDEVADLDRASTAPHQRAQGARDRRPQRQPRRDRRCPTSTR